MELLTSTGYFLSCIVFFYSMMRIFVFMLSFWSQHKIAEIQAIANEDFHLKWEFSSPLLVWAIIVSATGLMCLGG